MSGSLNTSSAARPSGEEGGASSSPSRLPLPEVVVHPLVLLSAVDHYTRVAKDTQKRVVGVLLGTHRRPSPGTNGPTIVDVTNSFAVPFEEDLRNPAVWFLDHDYLDTMYWKFKKVNTNEDVVGFYSSGPRIRENDLKINALFRQFCAPHEPVFVIIDVRPGVRGSPTTAYVAEEEVQGEGREVRRVFRHTQCSIEAEEAEEVGVEHLLRDVNDPSTSSLALRVRQQAEGLAALAGRLEEIRAYLNNVVTGRLPMNNQIMYNLQSIFCMLPNLNVEAMARALQVKTNDMYLVVYLSALMRSVVALHNLLNNKIQYRDVDDVLDRSAGVQQVQQPAAST